MKTAKKALSFILCTLMLATSLINEGWSSLIPLPEASAMAGHEQTYKDTRIELDFNKNWKFSLTDDDAAYLKGYDDSDWESVDIPHDFSISQEFTDEGTTSSTGSLPGGTGWYRKWFNLYEYYSGDRVILNFDGAYQHAYVYINGKYVGENHYGYNSFSFEIADYLICSNTVLNLIAVKVVNELPSSRWYSGSGINRDVTLTIAGPVHVSLYGPRITTPFVDTSADDSIDKDGTITANIKIHNCSEIAKAVSVEATILDENHETVGSTTVSDTIKLDANSEKSLTLNPSIANPKLWSLDDPNLYKLKVVVKNKEGESIDEYHTTFGYRSVEWDAQNGFKLNGENIKLKGVSLHHDQGALGSAQEYDAIYRQIVTLKDMGCNAIRTTHNTASKVLLDICNELGMLVIEEIFDGWDASKEYNYNDFSKYFNETLTPDNKAIGAKGQKWFQYVVEHTILRDEHNPCIIAWDVGNELCNITEGESTENYEAIATSIRNTCEKLDPSRAVLQGNNSPENDVLTMIDSKMDVIGGNYSPAYWAWQLKENDDARKDMPFIATESASALSCRGVYNLMVKQPDDETEAPRDEVNFQITSYDTDWVKWGNSAAEAWYYVITNDWFSGEFIWTGFDYIGEPTPWNSYSQPQEGAVPNSSYFGVVDTAGFEKDSYYLYRSLWNDNSTTLHLLPGTWNKDSLYVDENGYVNVAVYSNAAKIELLLNGEVIAIAESTINTTPADYSYKTWNETVSNSAVCNNSEFYTKNGNDFYSQFKVKYAAGTLSVKAYDENNAEITDTVGTSKVVSGTATKLAAKVWNDQDTFVADGTDYIYIEYEAQDENGNFINDYNGILNVKVAENSARYAEIVGVDNGNPATTDKFQQSTVISADASEANLKMFNGRALVILKTTEEEGAISISEVKYADSTRLPTQGVTVTSVSEKGIELTDEFEEVIRQTGNKYEVTLYDEYEIVKHHINNLEPPVGGGNSSDDSGETDDSGNIGESEKPPVDDVIPTDSDIYEIFIPNQSDNNGCIPDGIYTIFHNEYVLTGTKVSSWDAILADNQLTNKIKSSTDKYLYDSFSTAATNAYKFTHQGNNFYTIQNVLSGKYFSLKNYGGTITDTPEIYRIQVLDNGSVNIVNSSNLLLTHYYRDYIVDYFCGESTNENYTNTHLDFQMWLYAHKSLTDELPPVEEESNLYEIYLPESSEIISGDYVIYNQEHVLANNVFFNDYGDVYGISADNNLTEKTENTDGAKYKYESFNVSADNVYTFIPTANGTYYIQNKATGKYYTINSMSDNPIEFKIHIYDNGSMNIVSVYNYYVVNYTAYGANFAGDQPRPNYPATSNDFVMWLYKPVNATTDEPVTPPADDEPVENKEVFIYLPNSVTDEAYIPDGEYVIYNKNYVLSNGQHLTWAVTADGNITNKVLASDATYEFESFETSADNVYKFINVGNNTYHIFNPATNQYLSPNGPSETPINFKLQTYSDGSVNIYCDYAYLVHYGYDVYFAVNTTNPDEGYTNEHEDFRMWLYTPKATSASSEMNALYDILFEGIEIDYSEYSRDSFEALLRALEEGVAVYENPNSTDTDYSNATQKIRNAINALKIDVKKINGTLFKYGYDNSNGTPDYNDGGILMNQISVEKMKNAILSNENLMNQIKAIIHYDDPSFGWSSQEYADKALEDAVKSYASIYSLAFTGKPIEGSDKTNAANTWEYLPNNSPQATLWNLWTKDNTHGENDTIIPEWDGILTPVHDGASVQGLAGSTLEKGVITSHSAYTRKLSYANDGPTDRYNQSPYDVTYHTLYVNTGNEDKSITLDYLSGISVYFPDVFTRESLDVDGNVSEATTGKFAKYYWDAKFPIFISTDQYGVNTYHFDSKDKQYLVQSTFDDANHKVEMELNEVGNWDIKGTTAQSGFFPFNYKQGAELYPVENAIYHYGFTFEHNFYIPKGGKHVNGEDVIFNFSGDDDVYVYIDGVLVLDNGGLHGPREVTINFTDCTINYQYAMDVTEGKLKADGVEYGTTYSYNEYFLNPDYPASDIYNADTIAALEKLHEVISDGQVHTLNFFYLERGSSDSNCKMSFNLSETSEEVRIIDQELTLDYGLPVEYNIKDNNNLSEAALDNNVTVEYLGICAVNDDVFSTYTFELPEIILPFEPDITYTVEGMKYGDCTIDKNGNVKYTLKSTNMTESEHFYVCAKITGDPTYAGDVTYYQLERTTFIPATTIYYEDTFNTITYTDGDVPSNYTNSYNYGIWQTIGEQETTLKQSTDLTDSEANPYGYETNYQSFAEFSGGSTHYVDVSTKNNPKKQYSGGDGGAWPTVDFTFTGTGFDLISVTDSTTGTFSVKVTDPDNEKKVYVNTVVNTFYGYNYGQLFADADGKLTLDNSKTPLYRNDNGTCTSSKRYYDEQGAITENVRCVNDTDCNEDHEYAYAYGWVIADANSKETLYQIPVIKIKDLEYRSYKVTITPTFTSIFGHYSTDADRTNYYRVYFDAIKIYSPAGIGDNIRDDVVRDAYATDDELYPDYLEIKDMLIGAESLAETDSQGVIFIDGIAALDNDLEKYKSAGPNNELYLAKDQAVAFEIWATSVPTDIQLGAKLACGKPELTVSYAARTIPINISSAHDTFYSLNAELPNDAKLTWHLVTGADGNKYYTTGTVVIQNTGAEDSVLSITNLKWTFSQNGGKGYFRIPTSIENEDVTVAVSENTKMAAFSLIRMRTADLSIEQIQEPEVITSDDGSSIVTIKMSTSSDVDSIIITDSDGKTIMPENVEKIATEMDGREVSEWAVTIAENIPGTHVYTIAGVYANGYIDYSQAVTVTVTVEAPPETEIPGDDKAEEDNTEADDNSESLFDKLIGFYNRIIEFFKALFALLGVNI